MANLIESIKAKIYSSHKDQIIVSDTDNLLDYDEIRKSIIDDGYRIISANTVLEVRLKYELVLKDSNSRFLLIVPQNYHPLPDMQKDVFYVTLGLKDIFRNLDAGAIKGLSFDSLNFLLNFKLFEALGNEKTIKFLLENLYGIDLDTLKGNKQKQKILNALIVVFLGKNHVNEPIAEYLTKLIQPLIPELGKSIIDRNKVQSFLQDKWSAYIYKNDMDLDFDESNISKSLGFLFISDNLKRLKVTEDRFKSIPRHLRLGVYVDENEDNDRDLDSLLEFLEERLNTIQDSFDEWFEIIKIISKTKLKEFQTANSKLKERFKTLEQSINIRFQRFIENAYSSLFSFSGIKRPIVVSRILDYIKSQPFEKKALLVIDGMNYWQGLLLVNALEKDRIPVNTKSIFSFIPSITAWSRQAIFRGNKPNLEEDNSKEEYLFREYWNKENYNPAAIEFLKTKLNQSKDLAELNDLVVVLGIVCNDLDDIMHGLVLGNDQLKSSTEQWIKESKIVEQIRILSSKGFKVFITTDHGNVEAFGIKNLKIKEKVGSLSRSKRHLHFSNKEMLSNFIEQNQMLYLGIKENSVYLRQNEAFTDEGDKVITHGGSHFWEVLIPFLEIG